MAMKRVIFSLTNALLLLGAGVGAAHADGKPHPWETGFQQAFSPTMERVNDFHNLLLVIITGICLVVLSLLAFVIFRFNARRNPKPSRTAHNTLLEVMWTIVPIMILVVIAVPSFRLLYFADRTQDAEVTLKAIGHQWYWTYEYPDNGNIVFDSFMVPAEDLKPGEPRLLETDNAVVLPVDTNIRLLTTATDVLHSWAMPAMGVKLDAIPGRVNETWFRIEEEGTYYGQCSELCGINHAFMPIEIEAVSRQAFAEWVEKQKTAQAGGEEAPVEVARAPSQD